MDCMYPESLPTLPTRRALYTGRRVYPFSNGNFRLKGDFVGAPGWGPIPEEQDTIAELLNENGYRTGLIADVVLGKLDVRDVALPTDEDTDTFDDFAEGLDEDAVDTEDLDAGEDADADNGYQ